MTRSFVGSARRAANPARAHLSRLLDGRFGQGISTGGDIRQAEQGYAYGIYRPTSWLMLHRLFGRLEIAEDDVLVDIGSGMGRVVLMAARHPFKRVIGIERAADLTQIARDNLAAGRHRLRCADIELLTVDALEWEVPDDLTVVYLYCPFPDEVLGPVLAKLIESLDRRPRSLRLLYNFSTTKNREIVMATGRARRVALSAPWYLRAAYREISMYRLSPAAP